MQHPARLRLLGADFDPISAPDLIREMEEIIKSGDKCIIGNHNLNSLRIFQEDPAFRRFYDECRLIFIDGMPIIYLARLCGIKLRRKQRTTSLDWMPLLLSKAAQNGWKFFYLGSANGVAELGASKLRAQYPGLQFKTHHGYFDKNPGSEENEAVLQTIREYRPNILLVGMGMPTQEYWISNNFSQLDVNIVADLGAYMDYIAGIIPTAPRWIGQLGFEWLFRLLCEPRRLWRRYLLDPFRLAWLVLRRRGLSGFAATPDSNVRNPRLRSKHDERPKV